MAKEKLLIILSVVLALAFIGLEYFTSADYNRFIPTLTIITFFLVLSVVTLFPKDYDHSGAVFVAFALLVLINVFMVYLELYAITGLMILEFLIAAVLLASGIVLIHTKTYHSL